MTPSRWSSAIAILRRRIRREEEERLLLRESVRGDGEPSPHSRWLPFATDDCELPAHGQSPDANASLPLDGDDGDGW